MKKLIAALVMAGMSCEATYAQAPLADETLVIKAVKKGDEPKQVMDAVKSDFPDVIVKDVAFLPSALYGREWALSERNNTDNKTELMFYQVSAYGPTGHFQAVYDKAGKLLSFKQALKDAELPDAVSNTLKTLYGDWTVSGDKEYFSYDLKKTDVAYRVTLTKGHKHKHLLIDPSGKIRRKV